MGKTKFQASRRRGKESLNDLKLNLCKAYCNFCQTELAITQGVGAIKSHDVTPKYTSAMLLMNAQNKFQNDDEKSTMPVKKLEFTPEEKIWNAEIFDSYCKQLLLRICSLILI